MISTIKDRIARTIVYDLHLIEFALHKLEIP